MKPELQQKMQDELGLEDNDFAYHATDLYVIYTPEIRKWLKKNYKFHRNVKFFISQENSGWNGSGLAALDIPFAGNWNEKSYS